MPAQSKRLVISWLGWDIHDFALFENRDFIHQLVCVERLVISHGLRFDRRGNNIDYIIGKPWGSVTHWEFFRFQREWERLNERLEFRMSGVLWLMSEGPDFDPQLPKECYNLGIKTSGDSIGRPLRHSLNYAKPQQK